MPISIPTLSQLDLYSMERGQTDDPINAILMSLEGRKTKAIVVTLPRDHHPLTQPRVKEEITIANPFRALTEHYYCLLSATVWINETAL